MEKTSTTNTRLRLTLTEIQNSMLFTAVQIQMENFLYHVRLCSVNFICLWYKLCSLVQCLLIESVHASSDIMGI